MVLSVNSSISFFSYEQFCAETLFRKTKVRSVKMAYFICSFLVPKLRVSTHFDRCAVVGNVCVWCRSIPKGAMHYTPCVCLEW
jgi:hypothetical protein